MPAKADEPLRKVTLNLYESDCQWFEREYGYGWTERLRQHVHNEVQARNKPIPQIRRTLGDLLHD